MSRKLQWAHERGVSDVVAFTFVFSIIITSVGLTAAVGFGTLNELQADEQAKNAERAMVSLSENIGEIQRGHAPGRTGEIKLNEGTLYIRKGDSPITVEVDTGGSTKTPIDEPLGAMYYDVGERKTTIGFEGGAVLRKDRGNSVLVEEPKFLCKPSGTFGSYAVVSVIVLDTDASQPALGGGTVQVQAREQSSTLAYAAPSDGTTHTVSVDINSNEFAGGWENHFDRHDTWSWSGGEATCSNVDAVYVRKTVVTIKFLT